MSQSGSRLRSTSAGTSREASRVVLRSRLFSKFYAFQLAGAHTLTTLIAPALAAVQCMQFSAPSVRRSDSFLGPRSKQFKWFPGIPGTALCTPLITIPIRPTLSLSYRLDDMLHADAPL